mmetsp:Transcript_62310/g.71448  ORF Transcript_62310/g.71448 Transcript_62310/m.71448 type:complete len:88 (+) Transcript_62310:241-504(+)
MAIDLMQASGSAPTDSSKFCKEPPRQRSVTIETHPSGVFQKEVYKLTKFGCLDKFFCHPDIHSLSPCLTSRFCTGASLTAKSLKLGA